MSDHLLDNHHEHNLLKPVPELSYLNAVNVGRYRCIMRYFYEQHLRLRYWLKPEEVLEGVRGYGLLEEYTLEQVQKDLDQLVEWKNILPRHDGGRSNSIEEYLRKKFRYQMTPYAVEIERLVEGLEKMRGYGGSLEPSLLETIVSALRQVITLVEVDYKPGEAARLWKQIYDSFHQMSQEAADYLAMLQSNKVEELMMTVNFLAYKSSLTQLLHNFVQGLQVNGQRIEGLLGDITEETVAVFRGQVIADWLSVPKLDEQPSKQEYQWLFQQEWQSLQRWFLGDGHESSDLYFLERATKDTIAKIVRCALRIQEKQRSGVSRRRELDYLGKWFLQLQDIDEAHCLAACTFGLYKTRHFQGHDQKGTDAADVSMWEEGPNVRTLYSRSRTRRREGSTQSMQSFADRQQQAKQEYLIQRREEAALLQAYVQQGRMSVADFEVVPAKLRSQLLFWIGKCMANKSKTIRTAEGVEISLSLPPDGRRTILKCEDGELDLPDYTLEFRDVSAQKVVGN